MYISPKQYAEELKVRINQLKQELTQLETVYNAMISAGVTVDVHQAESVSTSYMVENNNEQISQAEKIAESQRKRHRKRRDEKIPVVFEYIKNNGASSLSKLSKATGVTTESLKLIFEENSDKFRKNPNNQLWEIKK